MNKRHYEHTLPNIRGSLSNTYYSLTIFFFLPARKYRHIARFIPILTLTGIFLFYRFPYRFPGFILCRHRCVLSDAKVRCRA